jgi:hypothetical protein
LRAAEFCFNQYSKHNCTNKANQTFLLNPTLNTIVISGTAVKWYDTLGALYLIQPLCKTVTYYATNRVVRTQINSHNFAGTLPANDMPKCFVMI